MSAQTVTAYVVQQRACDETWTDSNPGYDNLEHARQHVRDWITAWDHDSGHIRIIGRFITTFEIPIE